MELYEHSVGVDVSATSLSISVNGASPFDVAQDTGGWKQGVQKLYRAGCKPKVTRLILEATGPYSVKPAHAFHQAGFQVSIINPLKSYYFAKMMLQISKTDALDAQTLATFGQHFQPRLWTPPPPIQEELYQRLSQRDAYMEMRQQILNQQLTLTLRTDVIPVIKERHQSLASLLDKHIRTLDYEIHSLLKAPSPYLGNAKLLLSIVGFGIVTVGWLLVATQNFAFAESATELAAFCGLVPHLRASGKLPERKRRVRYAGHERLRRAFYMATLSAGQYNPVIHDFYENLKARGKPKKVARIAAARKMCHLAWGVIHNQVPFDPDYKTHSLPLDTSPQSLNAA